ncbi:MAG: hypothetical protein HYU88_07075, partial [Chloroflexi bacterium]|nr:hypothetical protein [Chloroflexota bacterium]
AVAAGFEVVNALQLDKVQLTFKGVKGDKGEEDVTNKDVILNLQKPLGRPINGFRLAPDAEAVVAEAILAHLGGGPPADERGLQALQGLAIRALLNQGYQVEVSWRSVSDTLRDLGCKQVDGRWYLPGEDVAGATFEIRDEASAIGWLRQVIEQQGPQRLGTLIPRFQEASAGVVIRKELRELLAENFVLDAPTNTWRLPTPQERERLNDAKALGQRREIRRWLAGKAGRHYDDVELAELALAAFGFGLHEAVLAIAPLVRAEALPDSTRNELDQVQVIARMKLEASREAGAVQLPML